jgi:hypothetical protein
MKNLTASDLLEIQNLVATYCIATDNKDVDGFMNCWVEASDFEGYDSGAMGSMKTWEELRAFETHHVGPGGAANGKRHQATNIIITPVSDDEVRVTHDMLVLEVNEKPGLVATGRYNNSKVVRTSRGWKFQYRSLDIDPGFFKLLAEWQKAEASH